MKLVRLLIAGFDQVGYAAYCSVFSDDPIRNLEKIRTLMGRGVEHFVFLGCPYGHREIIQEIEERGLLYIGNSEAFRRWVGNGSRTGFEMLFRYLLTEVGERFKLICLEKEATSGSYRVMALQRIFPEHSHEQLVEKFLYQMPDVDFNVKDFRQTVGAASFLATGELLKQQPELAAIVYNNDHIALGGYRWLMQPGNERFHHLRLCGCNNESTLQNLPLPITSIAFDLVSQADLLVKYGLSDQPCQIQVAPVLHIRTSHGRSEFPPWDEKIAKLSTFDSGGKI